MTALTCAECIALAGDRIDGVLVPADVMRFEAHIDACDACARYHRVLVRGLGLARALPVIEPSSEFEAQLHRRLRETDEEMTAHQSSVRSGVAVALGLAAVVALVSWSPLLAPASRGVPGSATASVQGSDDSFARDPGADWFVGAVPTRAFRQPNVANTFPGPYSPLLVDPPLGPRHTVLTALTRAE